MTNWRTRSGLVAAALVCLVLIDGGHAAPLPDRLTDGEFWKLVSDISEPNGFFRITDNYTSNETEVGVLATRLREQGIKGGVYIGVGPEQNFSYIAAIRPAMAFILDIRRQAVMQHLMFKAVFEMAADRAEFVSLLFAKPKPASVDASGSIQKIWDAYFTVTTDGAAATRNYALIVDRLTKTHGFTLSAEESAQLQAVYQAFVGYGPSISTRGVGGGGGGNGVSFADLTGWSTDAAGVPQSFLTSDDNFRYVKSLHEKNLIIPVSGDFGGAKALRGIGGYLQAQKATVSAFYVSNVEQYLFQDDKARAFYANVDTLPLSGTSVFIRPYSLRRGQNGMGLCPIRPFIEAAKTGRIWSNNDALSCVQ